MSDNDLQTALVVAEYAVRQHEQGRNLEAILAGIRETFAPGTPDDPMSPERQKAFIEMRFRQLLDLKPSDRVEVTWEDENEQVIVEIGIEMNARGRYFLMQVGSDDDRYRFELWNNGQDTGLYVEFAFEGETL